MVYRTLIIANQNFYSSIIAQISPDFHDPELGKAKAGAGLMIVTESLEACLFRRSDQVNSPHNWGNLGGIRRASNQKGLEFSLITAIRESLEETDNNLPEGIILPAPIMYHRRGSGGHFFYLTYTLIVPNSAKQTYSPRLNWEHDEFRWFSQEERKEIKMHCGTKYVLERIDPANVLCAAQLLQDLLSLQVS